MAMAMVMVFIKMKKKYLRYIKLYQSSMTDKNNTKLKHAFFLAYASQTQITHDFTVNKDAWHTV